MNFDKLEGERMNIKNMKVFSAVMIIALVLVGLVYPAVTPSTNIASTPCATSDSGVIPTFFANAFANSTNNLMGKIGKSLNYSALSNAIVSDGSYVTGSGLFQSMKTQGKGFYWTIAFNTSNQYESTIYFLFAVRKSSGSQPEEKYLQISFPLYKEARGNNSASDYFYSNFTSSASPYSNDVNTSQPWAGYEFNSSLTGNKTVNSASSWFNVPKLSYPPPLQNETPYYYDFGEWVGISNGYGGAGGLLQTGVGIGNTSSKLIPTKYGLWWEDWPANYPQPYSSSSYAYPGDILWASVFDGYSSSGVPFYANFTVYDRNISIEYGTDYSVKEYTYHAQFIVESNDETPDGFKNATLPEFSPPANFEGGAVDLGLNDINYQITTLYNDSVYTNFTMMYDSGWWPNIYTKYTMQWNSFGDVQEYGYPTLTWNNSNV